MKQAIKRTLIRSGMYVLKAKMALIKEPKMPEPVDYSGYIHQNIDQFPFASFMDFYIDGSYWALLKPEGLAIKEKVDMLQLHKAGQKITEQYIDAMNDTNAAILELVTGIYTLRSRINRLFFIVESLKLNYNQELADTLRNCGYKKPITSETNLDEVQEYGKYLQAQLEQKEKEHEKLQGKGEKPTRKLFESILIQADPGIDTNKITTLRFCMIYQQLKARKKAIEDGKRKDR